MGYHHIHSTVGFCCVVLYAWCSTVCSASACTLQRMCCIFYVPNPQLFLQPHYVHHREQRCDSFITPVWAAIIYIYIYHSMTSFIGCVSVFKPTQATILFIIFLPYVIYARCSAISSGSACTSQWTLSQLQTLFFHQLDVPQREYTI